ncbi:glycopeptide antibiotics resistance protein [Paenibacillus cellulosilyticus]|uniref:Glycopeptide antibiotics resistance protein n=1 Tax=Paenibacillus cellulosilyticus TaxID=375489 RepID=A0A2V2YYN3_9BACL|nr:VanZ family protein [Paenibacillus cellulosilyticus]PWW07250.1 glycopeptide antibiotics resistance protein [Paenibacillus cellulosilyticus]QKS44560.1 VanZ family protein [Paenibacillus cellulosilyticus]
MNIQFTIPSWYVLIPLFLVLFMHYGIRTFARRIHTVPQFMLILSFIVYSLAVLHLVFFPIDVNIGEYANRTPWYKTINFIPILTIDIKTFVLNIVMMIPLGIYLPLLKSTFNRAASVVWCTLCISLFFEALQMIVRIALGSGRSTDINDLIANTLGGAVGFLACKILIKAKPIRQLSL